MTVFLIEGGEFLDNYGEFESLAHDLKIDGFGFTQITGELFGQGLMPPVANVAESLVWMTFDGEGDLTYCKMSPDATKAFDTWLANAPRPVELDVILIECPDSEAIRIKLYWGKDSQSSSLGSPVQL